MLLANNEFPKSNGDPGFWRNHQLKVDLYGRTDPSYSPRMICVERIYIINPIAHEDRVGSGLWVNYMLEYVCGATFLPNSVIVNCAVQNLSLWGDPQETAHLLKLAQAFGVGWGDVKEHMVRVVDGINQVI